jgi:hypothetical protein
MHALTRLTDLRLCAHPFGRATLHVTSKQFADCLAHMPQLTRLQLHVLTLLDSLGFLASGPVTHSLQLLQLTFFHPPLPVSELTHLQALTSLTRLTVHSIFDQPIDEQTVRLYTPPSALLPSLRHFSHHWPPPEEEEEEEAPAANLANE